MYLFCDNRRVAVWTLGLMSRNIFCYPQRPVAVRYLWGWHSITTCMFGAHGLVCTDLQTIVFEYEYKYGKYLDIEFVTTPGNLNQPFWTRSQFSQSR